MDVRAQAETTWLQAGMQPSFAARQPDKHAVVLLAWPGCHSVCKPAPTASTAADLVGDAAICQSDRLQHHKTGAAAVPADVARSHTD